MRDKYQNKGRAARFFHKNTGFITVGTVCLIIFVAWLVFDEENVFFENWSCNMIYKMKTEGMTEKELNRHKEIIQECDDRPIQYQTDKGG